LAEARQVPICPRRRFGLSVPLRWRPAHGCSASAALHLKTRRAQSRVRLERVQSVAHQCKHEVKPFKSKSAMRRLEAVLCAASLRLQVEKCSLSSSSRLTLPSRGQLPGYALQLPLMSNVRRHNTHHSHTERSKSSHVQICPHRCVSVGNAFGHPLHTCSRRARVVDRLCWALPRSLLLRQRRVLGRI
jgi:hypothetical protein